MKSRSERMKCTPLPGLATMVSAGGVAGVAVAATVPATGAVAAEYTFSSVPSPSL